MTRFKRRHRLTICALAAAILYLPGLGTPALWEPDEGRYAEIAREMVRSADYVTPRNDWVRYFEKPPLMYWVSAASIAALGTDEFAVRLPAAIFSAAEVVLTCAIGEAMFGAAAGMLAAMALALSPMVFGFARFLTLDPALAFFVAATLGSFYAAACSSDLGSGPGRRWLIGSAAMAAMGTLSKGPVALVLCGGVALIFMIAEGRWRELRRVPWMTCAIVYFAITAPWFAIVARRNPEFLRYFFVHEHLERYITSTEHGWGPWFFVPIAAAGTWPWLYFVPLGVSELRRQAAGEPGRYRSALRFLSIWFLVILVFFSIPRSKLGSYILPAIPALAILAGYGIERLCQLDSRCANRIWAGFAIANAAMAVALAIALISIRDRVGTMLIVDGVTIAACLALAAITCYLAARGGHVTAAVAVIAIGIVAAAGMAIKARGDAGPMGSYRRLAFAARPYLRSGCVLASYAHQVQSLPFYTGTREAMVDYLGELGALRDDPDARGSFLTSAELATLWGTSSCVVLVANQKDLQRLSRILRPEPAVIACEGKKLALFNRPVDRPPQFYDCR